MQAILTKYLPATNFKCSRIKATCERGSVVVSYDSSYSDQRAHEIACERLIDKFTTEDAVKYGTKRAENPWNRKRAVGQLPSGEYAHVFLS